MIHNENNRTNILRNAANSSTVNILGVSTNSGIVTASNSTNRQKVDHHDMHRPANNAPSSELHVLDETEDIAEKQKEKDDNSIPLSSLMSADEDCAETCSNSLSSLSRSYIERSVKDKLNHLDELLSSSSATSTAAAAASDCQHIAYLHHHGQFSPSRYEQALAVTSCTPATYCFSDDQDISVRRNLYDYHKECAVAHLAPLHTVTPYYTPFSNTAISSASTHMDTVNSRLSHMDNTSQSYGVDLGAQSLSSYHWFGRRYSSDYSETQPGGGFP